MVHSPKMSEKFMPICIVRSDGTAGAISTAPASNSTKRLDLPWSFPNSKTEVLLGGSPGRNKSW